LFTIVGDGALLHNNIRSNTGISATTIGAAVGSVGGSGLICLCCFICFFVRRKKKEKEEPKPENEV
jgi:hypothetical protein